MIDRDSYAYESLYMPADAYESAIFRMWTRKIRMVVRMLRCPIHMIWGLIHMFWSRIRMLVRAAVIFGPNPGCFSCSCDEIVTNSPELVARTA